MELEITGRTLEQTEAEALLVWALEEDGAPKGVPAAAAGEVQEALRRAGFRGKAGEVFVARPCSVPRVVVVAGLGKKDAVEVETIRSVRSIAVAVPGVLPPREEARAIAEGLQLSAYRFTCYKSDEEELAREKGKDLEKAFLCAGGDDAAAQGLRRGEITARAVRYARDLVNLPSADKKPEGLAERARKLAGNGVEVKVLDEAECRKLGMGGFLGVAAGSEAPPRFLHLHYRPAGKPRKKVALVGKGVTFDSGGLNLKAYEHMQDMKQDMAGAASVLAVFSVLPELGLPLEVHGIVAATENMPSGKATRPGDVLKAMSGKTIEVLNTDAEGRLTLADALVYAEKQGVDEIVDMATLTGACVIALGKAAGIFGRPQEACDRVLRAARLAGERAWQLPLFDDYRKLIKGDVADIKNTGGRGAGAVTAALFLSEFVSEKIPWVHMDIAGSAFTEEAQPACPKGATGLTAGTLVRYLELLAGGQEG
jgi:leucyl aminopeptidase